MSRQLQDIFEECVERLRQGDSIENCLMSYPEVAAELEVLLRTALNVNWRASMVQPRPEFKARARAQFIGAQQNAAQAKEARSKPTFFSLQRAWVPALVVVLILVFSSVGTAAAATNALPDETLYPMKIATEQTQLALTFSDEAKAELNVKLAETRSEEIAAMATEGNTEQVVATTERMAQNLDAAEAAIQKVEQHQIKRTLDASQETTPAPALAPTPSPTPAPEPHPSAASEKPPDATGETENQTAPSPQKAKVTKAEKLRQSLDASITKNVTILENAKNKSPEQAREAIQQAIDVAKGKQIQLQKQRSDIQYQPPKDTGNPENTPEPLGNTEGQESTKQDNGTESQKAATHIKHKQVTPSNSSGTSDTRDNS